jgi:soluble cytochrome b562
MVMSEVVPAVEVKPAPGATPEAAPVDPNAAPETPKPPRVFSQEELDSIVEKRLAKERRKREDIERRLKITEELHLRAQEKAPEKPAPKGDEPVRADYNTYEDFIEARAEWRAAKKAEEILSKRETQDRERQALTEQQKAGEEFRRKAKENAKDIHDFQEVMDSITADDPVAAISAMPIEASENPGKILYHLKKNPDEAERIASLPLGQQAREIWKLEQTLMSAKPPVKPSKAPEPIKPIGGKTAVGDEMPDPAKDPDKWMKWREGQIAARKRQGVRA